MTYSHCPRYLSWGLNNKLDKVRQLDAFAIYGNHYFRAVHPALRSARLPPITAPFEISLAFGNPAALVLAVLAAHVAESDNRERTRPPPRSDDRSRVQDTSERILPEDR